MTASARVLTPLEAASRLGVSSKALRVYEQRGLLAPVRTEAGWRTYGPYEMARAAEIVALRALGLSLAQVSNVLDGAPQILEAALETHQVALEDQARQLAEKIDRVHGLRADLARGQKPAPDDLVAMTSSATPAVSFDLPWPWGGERLILHDVTPLTYITGPLGSGKTQLANRIAGALPGGSFLGLDRLEGSGPERQMKEDPALAARVERAITALVEDGATGSLALTAFLCALEADTSSAMVVDLIEQGLDQASQEALIDFLRFRPSGARPLFLLTRSSAILDMTDVGPRETILLCPANHSPPIRVVPVPGSTGHEAASTCLASPEVRARTEGVVAFQPKRA